MLAQVGFRIMTPGCIEQIRNPTICLFPTKPRIPLLAEQGVAAPSEAKAQTGWSDRRNVSAELTIN